MRKKVGIGILVIVTVLCIVFAACTDSAKYRGAENVTDDSQTDGQRQGLYGLLCENTPRRICRNTIIKNYAGIRRNNGMAQ